MDYILTSATVELSRILNYLYLTLYMYCLHKMANNIIGIVSIVTDRWWIVLLSVQTHVLCHETRPALKFLSMQRLPYHVTAMDPQVCPLRLDSSQSVMSLDRSPASTFKPAHSRSSSTGSSKHSKQVTSLKKENKHFSRTF